MTHKPEHTHTSTQATNCAGCGKHKHTPLRIDKMGGYVCLTCIDKELGSLLGEFGYPLPVQGWKLVPYALTPEMSHIVETEMEGRDFADFWRDLLNAAPQPAPIQQEEYAWRFTGIAGLNRYMTQEKYDAQTPATKAWYEPYKCASCRSVAAWRAYRDTKGTP